MRGFCQCFLRRVTCGGRKGRVHVFDHTLLIGNKNRVGCLLDGVGKTLQPLVPLSAVSDVGPERQVALGLSVFIKQRHDGRVDPIVATVLGPIANRSRHTLPRGRCPEALKNTFG